LLLMLGGFRHHLLVAADSDYDLLSLESTEMGVVANTGNAVSRFVGSLTGPHRGKNVDRSCGPQLSTGEGPPTIAGR